MFEAEYKSLMFGGRCSIQDINLSFLLKDFYVLMLLKVTTLQNIKKLLSDDVKSFFMI